MTAGAEASASVRLPVVLHARPAAVLAREVGRRAARVTLDGVDAASVLALMRLRTEPGQRVQVVAQGPDAAEALDAVVSLIATGLGEGP